MMKPFSFVKPLSQEDAMHHATSDTIINGRAYVQCSARITARDSQGPKYFELIRPGEMPATEGEEFWSIYVLRSMVRGEQ